jgi:membrane protease YdiL (CAAX protease family)
MNTADAIVYYLTGSLVVFNYTALLLLLCWWLAGHLIMWRNRGQIKAAPAGTKFQPQYLDHLMVTAMCFAGALGVSMFFIAWPQVEVATLVLYEEQLIGHSAQAITAASRWLLLMFISGWLIINSIIELVRSPGKIEVIPHDLEDHD